MRIDLIFISYNRLHFTKYSLPTLLADASEEFSLTIWDNGSTDGSREYIESVKDPRIVKKVLSQQNIGAYPVVNQAINETKAELWGLVADDTLVTPGWTHILGAAHADIPELGRISSWHLCPDAFSWERARHKIQAFGRHKILRHPYTNGVGLVKTTALRKIGVMDPAEGESKYWMRMALAGYVIGFYCPPVLVEHMDYPWSPHFPYKGRFEEWVRTSGTASRSGFKSFDDAASWHEHVVRVILDGPWEVKHYVGWRGKLMWLRWRVRRAFLGARG